MKKTITVLVVLLAIGAIGFFGLPFIRSAIGAGQAQGAYQTEPARYGDITSFVGATGTVRANQAASILWQTSGQVATVRVEKGQAVRSGSVLSELEQSSLGQNIIMAQVELINAQRDLEKAMDNSEARSNAELALIQAEKALEDAEKSSQSKLYQRASQETIDINRANLITATEALRKAEDNYNRNRDRGEEDPIYAAALTMLARARQDQQRAEYNLRYVQELPAARDVEEANARLSQAQARLMTAQNEWERLKNGPDPRDITIARARVEAAQATLNLVRLAAPFDGVITAIQALPGDLVSTGRAAFQIEDLSRLLVDVQVSEVDINRVEVGQPVSLTFDAIPAMEYVGRVDEIASSDGAIWGSGKSTLMNLLGCLDRPKVYRSGEY
jgi:HlyD family secretion protein